MSEAEAAPELRIVGGDPTPEELAAATAVLEASLAELAGVVRRRAHHTPTTWERARRGLRQPLERGAWNRWGR